MSGSRRDLSKSSARAFEKFILLQWGQHYQFKDTLQFLPLSLEKQGESLKAGGDQEFVYLNDMADRMDYTEEQRALLKQKGIFPYDWFDSSEKLEHPAFLSARTSTLCCATRPALRRTMRERSECGRRLGTRSS